MKAFRVAGVLAAGCGTMYCAILRRPVLTWGATESEAISRLPGDELLEDASGMSTRAIDIDAPASTCGLGSPRWARRRAEARTHMTGSRICSASTCTASTESCRSSSIPMSAKR